MTDVLECISDTKSKDLSVGGFTIVRDYLRYKKHAVREILPYWMTSPVTCSADLTTKISLKRFKRIDKFLSDNLKKLHIKRLFPVQSSVIPYILDFYENSLTHPSGQPRDICISAPTGSGKTLCYALPIVQLLNPLKIKVTRAVIVLPVRDLAKQVADTLNRLIHGTSLRVALLAGETNFTSEQKDLLLISDNKITPADIVVCTPGRLVDHIYNTNGFCLEHVRFLVIDEADRVIVEEKQDWFNVFEGAVCGAMRPANLEKGNRERIFPLPTIASQSTPTQCTLQKILLSATLTHDPEPLKRFRLNFPRLFLSSSNNDKNDVSMANNPDDLRQLSGESKTHIERQMEPSDSGVGTFSTPSGLEEFIVELNSGQKPQFLAYLIRKKRQSKILCFTNAMETTRRLSFLMSGFGDIKVSALNASMPLTKRSRILKSFADGDVQILICTDAVARGIDIEDVSCVVSYEQPNTVKTYVHRIGRTARAGKTGIAYTLLLRNQIRFFKLSLRAVGKNKVKILPIHSSKLRPFTKDYKKALSAFQENFKKRTEKVPRKTPKWVDKNEDQLMSVDTVESTHI